MNTERKALMFLILMQFLSNISYVESADPVVGVLTYKWGQPSDYSQILSPWAELDENTVTRTGVVAKLFQQSKLMTLKRN